MREIFTRDEFFLIKKSIRFSDGRIDSDDIFYKVRPMIDQIINNTNQYYSPPEELSLDQSMIPFNGRSRAKVYTLTAAKDPIIINMRLYDGKTRTVESTITELLLPYEREGHRASIDRLYSSPAIFRTLESLGFWACGTCMTNRLRLTEQMAEEINSLVTGECCYFRSDSLLLCIWRDSKPVYMLTTMHNISSVLVERRIRKRDITSQSGPKKLTEKVKMPTCVNDCNNFAKGVDLVDQMISYYCFTHRSANWYWSIVYFLLEVASINSYVFMGRLEANQSAETT